MSVAITRPRGPDLVRAVTPAALILLFVIFAVASPTFRTPGNLLHILSTTSPCRRSSPWA
jgi:ribose/xylose/arabinose/galactoside ABC-type transport system permease subunit